MLTQLHDYYQSKGICAIKFNCPYFRDCSKFCQDTFTSAKEAFVSSGYESHEVPRVLFLSLDSGSADQDPKHKTLEYIRQQEEFDQDVLALPKNKHWYRTHELAYRILRHFKNDINIGDAKTYFAHINSAKCCMNNPGRAQANSLLFDNCREFIPGEIGILTPDILITQGAFAHQVVKTYPQIFKDMNIKGKNFTGIPEEIKVLDIFSKPTVWIQTFHPRNPSSKKNRDNYLNYEEFIIGFLKIRSEFEFPKVTRKKRIKCDA